MTLSRGMITTFLGILLIGVIIGCSGERSRADDKKKRKPRPKTEKKVEKEETNDQEEERTVPPEQLAKAKELISNAENLDDIDAKKLFKLNCSVCHGIKGNLMVNGAKDLTASKIGLEESVAQVYFGKGLMTPFKGILKDDEIVAVSKYVETMR